MVHQFLCVAGSLLSGDGYEHCYYQVGWHVDKHRWHRAFDRYKIRTGPRD